MLGQAAHAPGPSTSGDMQANASLEGWDSGDMEDFQEASSEVDGIPPALHLLADPAIPINIPETQVHHPVITISRNCTRHQASTPCHRCAVHDADSLAILHS